MHSWFFEPHIVISFLIVWTITSLAGGWNNRSTMVWGQLPSSNPGGFIYCCMEQCRGNYQYSRTRRWRKFQKGKIYNAEEHVAIESFVTTLIHWTFFSDDANKVGICWLCRSGQLHVTPSSRWSLPRCHRSVRNDMRLFLRTKQYPVQLRTTKYYSRRYKVLIHFYSVLQSTTKYYFVLQSTSPVLLPYYKVLVQYYKRLLQSSTTTRPVTSYYKVLLQYYFVLKSTSPVLLQRTPVLQSTSPVLLRTTKY